MTNPAMTPPESTEPRFRAESWYIPDTTLHRLNGTCVVNVIDETPHEVPWLSPDEADAFADALHRAAALARTGRETEDDDD